jgi:LuxR family maltose regulon positive regulatory protein
MNTSHLLTKLHHPQLKPNLVPRPHLINRLNEGLQQNHKMTLVAAPAGFGKTTLITEWLVDIDQPFAWLCLDEGDNDPVRFLALVVAALQTVDQRLGVAVQGILQSRQMEMVPAGEVEDGDAQWIQSAITALINEQISLNVSVVLILDDYHVIHQKAIHDMIQYLVENMPPLLHLVLVTREDPPCPLSRMRVRSELTEVRVLDLRFDESEAVAFMSGTMGLSLSAGAISTLNERAEGWVAGLQMAALSLQGLEEDQAAERIKTFSGSHHYVIDFFAEEVLRRQLPQLQQFMCQTSILESMSASLCDTVLDRGESQMLLDQLIRNNLFLVSLDGRQGWYRYHHLFRDFLRTRLEPDQNANLHRRAAHWYEAQGMFEQAVHHILAAGALDEAERVIGAACREAMEQGHLTTVVGWLDALPSDRIRNNSELACYKGWALCLMGQREVAEQFAAWAEVSLTSDARPTQIGERLSLEAYLAVQRGDNNAALELAQEALSKMDKADPGFQTNFFSAALLSLGHAQRGIGDTQTAINTYHQAVFGAGVHGDQLSTMGALEELSLLLHRHGRRQEAAALCRQAINRCTDVNGDPLPMTGMAYIVLAMLDFEADDLENAFKHVRRGLELCQRLMIPMITLRGKLLVARLQQTLGHYQMATDTLQVARQVANLTGYPRFKRLVEATAADIHLLQGEIEAAARWAGMTEFSPNANLNPGQEGDYLVYARFLLAQERWEDVELLLEKLGRLAEEQGRYGSLIRILVFRAVALQSQEQPTQAHDCLKQALNLAAPRGYYRSFLEAGKNIADLLSRLQPEAPEMVETLLAKIRGEITPSSDMVFPLVEPLSEREMEVLRLVRQGLSNREVAENLVVSEWTVKKHLTNVYSKLGVKNRTQAIARAREIALLA